MPVDIMDLGDSPPPPPAADLWLGYGGKLVQDAPASLRRCCFNPKKTESDR